MDLGQEMALTDEGPTVTSEDAGPAQEEVQPVSLTFRIVVYVVGTPLAAGIIIVNILLLVVMQRYPKLQTKTALMMKSWCMVDLLTGILVAFLVGVVSITWSYERHKYLCLFWLCLNIIPFLLTWSHVVFIAIDRYMAIKFPTRYADGISMGRLRCYLTLAWIYAFFLSVVTFFWHAPSAVMDGQCSYIIYHKYYNLLLLLLHCIPCVSVAVLLYAKSFLHVRRHERQVHVTHTLAQDQFQADHMSTKVFFFVTVLHTLTWMPYFIAIVCRLGQPIMYSSLYLTTNLGMLCGFTNAATKMAIYVTRHQDVRECIKDLFESNKRPVRVPSRACSRP